MQKVSDFIDYIKEGQKWQLQKRGLWSDGEDEKALEEKNKWLYENRLTPEKSEKIEKYMKGE